MERFLYSWSAARFIGHFPVSGALRIAESNTSATQMEGSLAEAVGAIASRPTILVADRGGPTMFARIGVMRALNRHVERVFDPSRKESIGADANSCAIDEAGSRRGRSMSQG